MYASANTSVQILCIDDDSDILFVLQTVLETAGAFNVNTCERSVLAEDHVRQHRPDVVLLDMMMPERDGVETLMELKRLPEMANVPVIMVTARGQPSEVEHYVSLGARGAIVKPFDPMTLCDQVRLLYHEAA